MYIKSVFLLIDLFDPETSAQIQVSYDHILHKKKWQAYTFYLLPDKSLSHIYKQWIGRTKKISAAPLRISINCIPEAQNIT